MSPRLLDLFCGAGGCSVGYHRAGFEVVGVDIAPLWRSMALSHRPRSGCSLWGRGRTDMSRLQDAASALDDGVVKDACIVPGESLLIWEREAVLLRAIDAEHHEERALYPGPSVASAERYCPCGFEDWPCGNAVYTAAIALADAVLGVEEGQQQ